MDMKAQWQGMGAADRSPLSPRERILILLGPGSRLLRAMGIYGWLDDADAHWARISRPWLRRKAGSGRSDPGKPGQTGQAGAGSLMPQVREQLASVETTLRQMDAELLAPDGGSDPRPRNARGAGGPVVLLRQPAYAGAHLPQARAADGRGGRR